MSKTIKTGEEARSLIIDGIDKVANIVKTTVGPKGRNVLIRNQVSAPIITNDGVTIAKSIELKDNTEDAGAQLMIQAAKKTNDVAGDGTTTTTILAQEMIHRFFEQYNNADINVVQVQKEMIKASEDISEFLKSIAVPVTDNESIEKVATISSGSADTGKLIAQAFERAGEYGSVIIEDSKTGKDDLVSIQGMKLSNGSVIPYLLDRKTGKTEIFDAGVLITKDKLDNVTDLFSVLEKCVSVGRNILIICDDIDFEPLNMVLGNKARGVLSNIGIIRLPGFGDLRENLVDDICVATGATLLGRDLNKTLKDFDISMLGEVEQVTISNDDTILKFKDVSSSGLNLLGARQERVGELMEQEKNVPAEQKEQFSRRISNLLSGVSAIQVGGNSEVEIKDRKLRIEDALNSVQSAKEEGIVAGGGYSFLQAFMKVQEEKEKVSYGEAIVYNSLTAVTAQIAENSGVNGDEVVTECVNKKLGYNALTNNYENLVETGVINSVKVDRYSLINATSVASTVITMGGSIVEENEPERNVLQLQAPIGGLV